MTETSLTIMAFCGRVSVVFVCKGEGYLLSSLRGKREEVYKSMAGLFSTNSRDLNSKSGVGV